MTSYNKTAARGGFYTFDKQHKRQTKTDLQSKRVIKVNELTGEFHKHLGELNPAFSSPLTKTRNQSSQLQHFRLGKMSNVVLQQSEQFFSLPQRMQNKSFLSSKP